MRLPLSAADRAALREKLMVRSRALRTEVASALHANGEILAIPGHAGEADGPVVDLENDLEVAGIERDAGELETIEYALAHLDSPMFGTCEDCREAIACERLFAEPSARRCLSCEKRAERSQPRKALL